MSTNKMRVLTPHRFTTNKPTVGKILTNNYLNDQFFNYVVDGQYSVEHRGKCGWIGDREVIEIKTMTLNDGEIVEVVRISGTTEGVYIPLVDFKT
jgi:hypothetical protein